jgi:hypothetical protein
MEDDSKLSEQDSLQLIEQMIFEAKRGQKDDGKGWILWGYLIFGVSIFTALNMRYRWFSSLYIFWDVFGFTALCYFLYRIIYYFVFKPRTVKTYTGDLLKKLNIGFLISMAFIIVAVNLHIDPVVGFPILINLYGFWVFWFHWPVLKNTGRGNACSSGCRALWLYHTRPPGQHGI